MRAWLLVTTLLAFGAAFGCGDDETKSSGSGASSGDAGHGDPGGASSAAGGNDGGSGGTAPFVLTSSVVADNGPFPVKYACSAYTGGTNVSPPLDWAAGPPGTMSYAIFFKDLTLNGFAHSLIWDIPQSVEMLPEDVDKNAMSTDVPGAKQCKGYDGATFGYLGPCPGNSAHNYQFVLYAVDVATLPGVATTDAMTTIVPVIEQHMLDQTTLTVVFTPP